MPERGPLPDTLIIAYEAAHAPLNGAGAPAEGEPVGAAPPPSPGPESPGGGGRQGERTPRDVPGPSAAGRARAAAGRFRTRFGGGRGRKRPGGGRRRGHSRVPVTDMIEEAWEQIAWAAAPILPLNRILSVQSPFAGVILEETVRDTFLDGLLQPVARTEKAGRALTGLLGPPAIVMVMLQADPDSQRYAWLKGMLRFSLLSLAKACDLNAEEAVARAEQNKDRNLQVDMLIAYIFSAPGTTAPGPQTVPGEVIREDETAAAADAEARMRQAFGTVIPAGEG